MDTEARQDEYQKEEERFILQESMEILVKTMKPNNIMKHLKHKKILSTRKDEENMLQIPSDKARTRELLEILCKSSIPSLHQIKVALIKTDQSELLQHLARSKHEDEDIMKSFDGKFFIHLQHDVYVGTAEYKGQMYIHIRHYEQEDSQKIATKQGATLTYSRWLLLESKRGEIDRLFRSSLNGTMDTGEYVMHLGGGLQVTINSKFPTVDIRHFWKTCDMEKPLATKRGVALNIFKWERLSDVMKLIRECIPALDKASICYETHLTEFEVWNCKKCTPFESKEDEDDDEEEEISPNQEGNIEIMKNMLMSNPQ